MALCLNCPIHADIHKELIDQNPPIPGPTGQVERVGHYKFGMM